MWKMRNKKGLTRVMIFGRDLWHAKNAWIFCVRFLRLVTSELSVKWAHTMKTEAQSTTNATQIVHPGWRK
jgi:hypothetical protein